MSRPAALLIGTVFAVGFVVIFAPVVLGGTDGFDTVSRLVLSAIQAWLAWTHLAHAKFHARANDEGPEGAE